MILGTLSLWVKDITTLSCVITGLTASSELPLSTNPMIVHKTGYIAANFPSHHYLCSYSLDYINQSGVGLSRLESKPE